MATASDKSKLNLEQSLLLAEFARLADSCPGRSHVIAKTILQWDVSGITIDPNEERFPLIEPLEWLRIFAGRRDDILNAALAQGGRTLRAVIGHHVFDAAPLFGLDCPSFVEGAFHFAQLPNREFPPDNSDLIHFSRLASRAEAAFGIVRKDRMANHARGVAWLLELYKHIPCDMQSNTPVWDDLPEFDELELKRFSEECCFNYERAINHPDFGPRVKPMCRRWYNFWYLPTSVYQASAQLIQHWQEGPNEQLTISQEAGSAEGDFEPVYSPHDLLRAFRDGETDDGEPLTKRYLSTSADWALTDDTITSLWRRKALTKRVWVKIYGKKQHAYQYKELAAIRLSKTRHEDKPLDSAEIELRKAEVIRARQQRCQQ